jgi:uncharacterized membrane protein
MRNSARLRRSRHRLRRLKDSPVVLAAVGGLAGALVAGGALALDYAERWQLTAVSTSSARTMFGALLTGAITATAVLFWIRGTLVQLAANELSPRVLRGYLNDWFLHLAFAFLMAVFTHALVTLLGLPASDAEPVPAAAALSGAVLASLALLLIIHAVYDSVQAMDASRVLTAVTTQTLASIRRTYPADGDVPSAAPDPGGEGRGRTIGSVAAPRAGWITEIDHEHLTRGVPEGGVIRLTVHKGDFVLAGTSLAVVSARGTDATWDEAVVESGFMIEDEWRLEADAEYGLGMLVALAQQSLSSGSTDRSTAFEALRCLTVLLAELLRREPVPPVLAFDGDRVVVRRFGRGHADVVRATVGEIRHAAPVSPEFTRALFEDLRRLASGLDADGLHDRAQLVHAEMEALQAASRGTESAPQVAERSRNGADPRRLTASGEPR